MRRVVSAACAAFLLCCPLHAWKNPTQSKSTDKPLFGTHDYIAYKAYRMAGPSKLPWLKKNLNFYFLGTEAPDWGTKLMAAAKNGYHDTGECHCILFDAGGKVSRDHGRERIREEFNKAKKALADGDQKLAAFYAGAMAHYVGDLSQFCHIMGKQSHWGSEDEPVKIHSRYEVAVEKTIDLTKRKSSLLESYIKKREVDGNTAEEVALAVAKFIEKGNSSRGPGWMRTRYGQLVKQKKASDPGKWDKAFQDQTGQNVNYSVNAIAKLLGMI